MYISPAFLVPFLIFLAVIFYTTFYWIKKFKKQKEFNEKLRLSAQKRDKEARLALEDGLVYSGLYFGNLRHYDIDTTEFVNV